jgi:glycosyltransferase involved in cell wall biosynthesis
MISEAGKRRLEEMDTPPEKIRLIRNGVDLEHFDPARFQRGRLHTQLGVDPSRKIILFAGRLDPVKRAHLLPAIARELRRLRGKAAGFHFAVAGDGLEAARLRSAIHSSGLARNFSLLGHVPDLAELLAGSDILLIPSQSEGIPLVLLEALAMEVPVVACRAGAIAEALPAACGMLVESGPYEETRLAEALGRLLDDPQQRASMGKAGRAFVEDHHSKERAAALYRVLLDELDAVQAKRAPVQSTSVGQRDPS